MHEKLGVPPQSASRWRRTACLVITAYISGQSSLISSKAMIEFAHELEKYTRLGDDYFKLGRDKAEARKL